jgi:NAD(P)-dependent dehydrogenase (short-subunit alcohol dehydrogenase family)
MTPDNPSRKQWRPNPHLGGAPPRVFLFLRVYNPGMGILSLSGRTALVTGGAVRLGRAIALGMAERGADISLHYHASEAAAERTAEEIRALGRKCLLIRADLAEPDSPGKILEAANAVYGKTTILINSAAIFERGTLAATTPDLWEKTVAINLRAPFFLCQKFSSQTDRGDVIFIADARAERPGSDFLAYTLAKSALLALTRSLAKSLAPGVRVNAVAPGAVLPPPGEGEEHLKRLIPRIPLDRPGTPEDVVRGVIYLLESPFVTGEVLRIDGGEYL